MKTTQDKEQFIHLRAKGYSYDKIATQLAVLGSLQNAVLAELQKRDLSTVSEDKLIALGIQLSKAIRQEEPDRLVKNEPFFDWQRSMQEIVRIKAECEAAVDQKLPER